MAIAKASAGGPNGYVNYEERVLGSWRQSDYGELVGQPFVTYAEYEPWMSNGVLIVKLPAS